MLLASESDLDEAAVRLQRAGIASTREGFKIWLRDPDGRASDSPAPTAIAQGAFAQIERSVGKRVGVFAIDTGSGEELAHRADERFALCSTFKWVLLAAVLARVDRGQVSMDERVPYGRRTFSNMPQRRARTPLTAF